MKNTFLTIVGLALCAVAFLFTSCSKMSGGTKVSATGSIYECLVVMSTGPLTADERAFIGSREGLGRTDLYGNGSAYDEPIATAYDMVRAVMEAAMPGMPQYEPYFQLTHVTPQAFDDFLKPTRNILIVDINSERYTQTKVKYSLDYWSTPQAVYRIQCPDQASFIAYWAKHGELVREWFVDQELRRQARFYRASTNKEARAALRRMTGYDMLISEDYTLLMDSTEYGRVIREGETKSMRTPRLTYLWCCNNKGTLRRDLIVYTYPYTDQGTFTLEYLNMKRDEVLSRFISATVPGSYMGTEYKQMPPVMRVIAPKDTTQVPVYEVRGLWKILEGEPMGGPYVNRTILDTEHQRIITAEVYVLGPGQKKRNALRQAEAILTTLQPAE